MEGLQIRAGSSDCDATPSRNYSKKTRWKRPKRTVAEPDNASCLGATIKPKHYFQGAETYIRICKMGVFTQAELSRRDFL